VEVSIVKSLKWILLAVVAVVAAAGAAGAYAYNMGRQDGMKAGLTARNDFLAARAGGPAAGQGDQAGQGGAAAMPGGANRGGQGAMAGNFTAGQVKSVNGNEVEVSTATAVTKVKLTDKTQIEKTVAGTPADLKPGERVVIQGAKAADGSVEASMIQLGAGRFAGAGGQGQGGQ
jgi:flagellar basal body-associated protein FliL